MVVYDKFVKASHFCFSWFAKRLLLKFVLKKTTISRQIVDSFLITIFFDKIYIDFFAYTKLFRGGRF